MKVVVSKDILSSTWILKVLNNTHNHIAFTVLVARLAHRITSLDSVIRNQVESLWRSGVANT